MTWRPCLSLCGPAGTKRRLCVLVGLERHSDSQGDPWWACELQSKRTFRRVVLTLSESGWWCQCARAKKDRWCKHFEQLLRELSSPSAEWKEMSLAAETQWRDTRKAMEKTPRHHLTDCVICFEAVSDGGTVCLCCGSWVHKPCGDQWLFQRRKLGLEEEENWDAQCCWCRSEGLPVSLRVPCPPGAPQVLLDDHVTSCDERCCRFWM